MYTYSLTSFENFNNLFSIGYKKIIFFQKDLFWILLLHMIEKNRGWKAACRFIVRISTIDFPWPSWIKYCGRAKKHMWQWWRRRTTWTELGICTISTTEWAMLFAISNLGIDRTQVPWRGAIGDHKPPQMLFFEGKIYGDLSSFRLKCPCSDPREWKRYLSDHYVKLGGGLGNLLMLFGVDSAVTWTPASAKSDGNLKKRDHMKKAAHGSITTWSLWPLCCTS